MSELKEPSNIEIHFDFFIWWKPIKPKYTRSKVTVVDCHIWRNLKTVKVVHRYPARLNHWQAFSLPKSLQKSTAWTNRKRKQKQVSLYLPSIQRSNEQLWASTTSLSIKTEICLIFYLTITKSHHFKGQSTCKLVLVCPTNLLLKEISCSAKSFNNVGKVISPDRQHS